MFLPDISTNFILSAYADIIIFIKNQEDVNKLGKIVETFGKISAKVNWAKSEALAIGRWSVGLAQLPGGAELEEGGS